MKSKRIIKQRVPKRVFLKRTKKRLENEVGLYLQLLDNAHSQNPDFPKVGFWAGIRLLMPVIDSLSSVLMHKGRTDIRPKPVRFMEQKLNMQYPHIVWEMFRHTLAHGDEMRGIKYKNYEVSWGISMNLNTHVVVGGHYGLDIHKLYGDLITFLEAEIPNATGFVYPEHKVFYNDNANESIKREIKNIQQ